MPSGIILEKSDIRLDSGQQMFFRQKSVESYASIEKSAKSLMRMNPDYAAHASYLSQLPILMEMNTPLAQKAKEHIRMLEEGPMKRSNRLSRIFRSNIPKYQKNPREYQKALADDKVLSKSYKAMEQKEALRKGLSAAQVSKATLDVGTLTDFTQITGGQSLGYVSLDTRMARGTIRPESFTLYNALKKTAAFQVVDYWAYANYTGGPLPGSTFAAFDSVSNGTLQTSAGSYQIRYITLKLALNGRAITVALAAQNSFVNVQEQENANAALDVLSGINWACYWGLSGIQSATSATSGLYTSQFQGIYGLVPPQNQQNFNSWYKTQSGLTTQQGLYNLIYETAALVVSPRNYGKITHAFMSPETIGDMQSLITTLLNNIVTNITQFGLRADAVVVNGDLEGMKTRFGDIQFVTDILINARNKPAQAIIVDEETGQYYTSPNLNAPASVAVTTLGATTGSLWDASYAPSGNQYVYAASTVDSTMNESTLTYSPVASGVAPGGAYQLTLTAPSSPGPMVGFRIYRSGLGYNETGSNISPQAFRYIGEAVYTSGVVTFTDLNTWIPGSETIFLLDMEEKDDAIDYRYLLPLSRIELFASNLFMPWAVATIGSIRLKVPKFHAVINNYVVDSPAWNPLEPYVA
jgi:hypothetical protein